MTPRDGEVCSVCGYPVAESGAELCPQCIDWQRTGRDAFSAIQFNKQQRSSETPAMSSKRIGHLFGMSDDDLTTPGHDALVLWAQKHWRSLVDRHIGPWADERLAKSKQRPPDEDLNQDRRDKGLVYYRPQIEVKCSSGGWIDLLGTGKVDGDSLWMLAVEVKTTIRSLGELLRQLRQYEGHRPPEYQGYYSLKKIVVLSPDAKFRDAIESQGFGFHWVCMDAITSEIESGEYAA